jgi:hypothetical protein
MSLWRQITYGLRGVFGRDRREEDVAEEVAQYYEEAEAEWRERGLSAEEARRAVRREAGSMTAARDAVSGYGWENGVTAFIADLRFAARQLWKHPGFTATAVLTLALGDWGEHRNLHGGAVGVAGSVTIRPRGQTGGAEDLPQPDRKSDSPGDRT